MGGESRVCQNKQRHKTQLFVHHSDCLPYLCAHIIKAQPPGAEKGTACLHIDVLCEAPPSALGKQRIKDTPRGIHHATHLTYPAFLEILGGFSHKAKYARLRTPRGPRMGFREPFSLSAQCAAAGQRFRRPNYKIRSDLNLYIRSADGWRRCPPADSKSHRGFCAARRARHLPPDKISTNYTTVGARRANRLPIMHPPPSLG